VYFGEPGGNTLEIEYYDPQAAVEGRSIAKPHWDQALDQKAFPGRGYIPQALTHGTLECDDKDASAAFYRDVLGLQIAGGGRISVYIKHASTPWYIVVLPIKRRKPLSPVNRFTLKMAGRGAVMDAHRELSGAPGITEIFDPQQRDGQASFLFSDLDRNWWEASS
jgi:catechol 2,3-dioxygenase-like lactoylglutathione lyase family enzyme